MTTEDNPGRGERETRQNAGGERTAGQGEGRANGAPSYPSSPANTIASLTKQVLSVAGPFAFLIPKCDRLLSSFLDLDRFNR